MISKQFVIKFEEGLHARPASDLVKVCHGIASKITITKDELKIDSKSILGILSMGAKKDDVITVEINGDDEQEGIIKLQDFFQVNNLII